MLAAREAGLRLRVYAAAPWPDGSRLVFESDDDLARSFAEVHRRGVWWEVSRRYELPAGKDVVFSGQLGQEAARIFKILLPVLDRFVGEKVSGHPDPTG
jgi:hypothetical protein